MRPSLRLAFAFALALAASGCSLVFSGDGFTGGGGDAGVDPDGGGGPDAGDQCDPACTPPNVCVSGSCGCLVDDHCDLGTICDGTTNRCEEGCRTSEQCPGEEVCLDSMCVDPERCTRDEECPDALVCNLELGLCECEDSFSCELHFWCAVESTPEGLNECVSCDQDEDGINGTDFPDDGGFVCELDATDTGELTDCDDADSSVAPVAPALCDDGVVNDCRARGAGVGRFGEIGLLALPFGVAAHRVREVPTAPSAFDYSLSVVTTVADSASDTSTVVAFREPSATRANVVLTLMSYDGGSSTAPGAPQCIAGTVGGPFTNVEGVELTRFGEEVSVAVAGEFEGLRARHLGWSTVDYDANRVTFDSCFEVDTTTSVRDLSASQATEERHAFVSSVLGPSPAAQLIHGASAGSGLYPPTVVNLPQSPLPSFVSTAGFLSAFAVGRDIGLRSTATNDFATVAFDGAPGMPALLLASSVADGGFALFAQTTGGDIEVAALSGCFETGRIDECAGSATVEGRDPSIVRATPGFDPLLAGHVDPNSGDAFLAQRRMSPEGGEEIVVYTAQRASALMLDEPVIALDGRVLPLPDGRARSTMRFRDVDIHAVESPNGALVVVAAIGQIDDGPPELFVVFLEACIQR
jgi:hypothetical protein